MTSYEKTFARYPTLNRIKIEAKINNWSTKHPFGQRVARNLFSEHFLPEDEMKEILSLIENDVSPSWKDFESKYQELCFSLSLKGEDVHFKKNQNISEQLLK